MSALKFVKMPDTNKTLIWDDNAQLNATDIPENTEVICLGDRFDVPIDSNILPDTIEFIVFGRDYDQAIAPNVLPNSLVAIQFGYEFNQPISENVLPAHLRHIEFGFSFNQPINAEFFPDTLEYIGFGNKFNQMIDVTLLRNLKTIRFGWEFNKSFADIRLPNSIEYMSFEDNFVQQIDNDLPSNLLYMSVSSTSMLESFNYTERSKYFSIIFNGGLGIIKDIRFSLLHNPKFVRDSSYEIIGAVTVDGKKYDKIINPETYQPWSNAKSARK